MQEPCRFLDVVRDRGRAEEGEIFITAQKAGSRQTIMVFAGCEWSLAGASGYCDLGVAGFIILAQRSAAIPFALNLILDAKTPQSVPSFLRAVGGISVKRCLVTEQ